MANHFYGSSIHEHAEKDVKATKPIDWVIFISFFALFIGAFIAFFTLHIELGIVLIGLFFMMFDVAARVIFKLKSKITPIFSALGVAIIFAGILAKIRGFNALVPYGTLMYCIIWLSVGIFCWNLGAKNKKRRRQYSLVVDADCMIVDSARIRLFHNPMQTNRHPKYAETNKPAFHYYVNGNEYYVESEIYYGDLNREFQDGNTVKLCVDPIDPHNFIPLTSADSAMETTMGVFGLILGGGGLIAWIILLVMGIMRF